MAPQTSRVVCGKAGIHSDWSGAGIGASIREAPDNVVGYSIMSLPLPAKRFATVSDLEGVPEHLVGEIVGGELYTSPRPAAAHTRAASRLGGALDGPFDRGQGGPGGWIILDEPELHLKSSIVVPDLAGWRRTTMPLLPPVAFFDLAPNWVCEILWPATESFDRSIKMPLHAESGVAHAWLIDPIAHTLEVYERASGTFHLVKRHDGYAVVNARPFAAVPLDLSGLWAR